jgi:hypothetical protein
MTALRSIIISREDLAMNASSPKSPPPSTARTALRVGGPIIAGVGLVFVIIGMASFFSSFGAFEPPRYFWCAFVGLPLVFVGLVMTKFGYLGAVVRYISEETSPVAKDTFNYLAENTQPGVKNITKAATDGILEAQREHETKQTD